MTSPAHPDDAAVVTAVRHWLERAVIGLNLCPFARAVYVRDQVRLAVSDGTDARSVLSDLQAELLSLADTDPQTVDTTLVIVPAALHEFHDYTHCLADAERLLKRLKLRGIIQIASFHPDYCFGDAEPEDIGNYTNRAPYPIFHLLREDSVARAVHAIPDPDDIVEANQRRLREMGLDGWRRWMAGQG
ncbi:DUF1415 domain-containing protein [Verticiella sediminum]|uniref:DUF1415 domain-containing protein n=1 Tax=Verticiella sediminum TaxID=1247510 RepID=A0A556ATZ5_9BURK|nr:DUF1415 domain-containing protein [Verticiella sediminum]TSH96418.1 DUF1415 domain-containing protein [Verticiella sediminum]